MGRLLSTLTIYDDVVRASCFWRKIWQSENDGQERRFMLDIEGGLPLK
jgi:hypothetical protein